MPLGPTSCRMSTMPFRLALVLLALVASPAAGSPVPAPGPSPSALCRAAIQAAERTHGIPHALLSALGRVESGRRDPTTGAFGPWPWTINAEGRGQFFASKAEAIAEVRRLQASGVRSVDVGCMQVNLMFHPQAFATLEDAFEPARNADYAARFLVELQQKSNNWLQAASHYHSHTPEFAEAYRQKVVAAWPEESRMATGLPRTAMGAAPMGASAFGGPGRVITIRPSGGSAVQSSGRGLAAYRASPIPLVGRRLPRVITPTAFAR